MRGGTEKAMITEKFIAHWLGYRAFLSVSYTMIPDSLKNVKLIGYLSLKQKQAIVGPHKAYAYKR